MEIKENDYSVKFDADKNAVLFDGTMRLQGLKEYDAIKELLQKVHDKVDSQAEVILDFSGLKFLNSSGITTISMFVIQTRNEKKIRLKVLGSKSISWQEKSLHNLNKLWKEVQIEIND